MARRAEQHKSELIDKASALAAARLAMKRAGNQNGNHNGDGEIAEVAGCNVHGGISFGSACSIVEHVQICAHA